MNDLRTAAQQALEYMKSIGEMDMYPADWAIVGRLEAALAAPVQDWDELEALRESLREHMAEIHRLRASSQQQAEPVQEPVLVVEKEPDYWCGGHFHQGRKSHIDPTKVWSLPIGTKLYTAPPQRKPLTDEEALRLWAGDVPRPVLGKNKVLSFTRALERAHGIGDA